MKRKTNKFATYGIFEISETGADSLYTARNEKGKPFMSRSEANTYLSDHIKPFHIFNGRNFMVKVI